MFLGYLFLPLAIGAVWSRMLSIAVSFETELDRSDREEEKDIKTRTRTIFHFDHDVNFNPQVE